MVNDEKNEGDHGPACQLPGCAWLNKHKNTRHEKLSEHLDRLEPPKLDTVRKDEETKTVDDVLLLDLCVIVAGCLFVSVSELR